MRDLEITGRETASELIKMLVRLRLWETILQKSAATVRDVRAGVQKRLDSPLDRVQRASSEELLEDVNEWLLNRQFDEIKTGQFLIALCSEIDRKGVSREAVFDVINTNVADRTRPDIKKYGDSTLSLIAVLDLENSASVRGDDWINVTMQPLRWCWQRAFMNALDTNPRLGQAVHDVANEHFDGAFGEYRDDTLMTRLTGGAA